MRIEKDRSGRIAGESKIRRQPEAVFPDAMGKGEMKKGADRSAPFIGSMPVPAYLAGGAPAALLKPAYISLPTKPNLVTPEPLMMFRTLADSW